MNYTSRTVADPVMNQIAKGLMTVQWQFDLPADEENVCLELEGNPELPKRLITLMRDYKTWAIRMYLAGAQRTFGFYSNAKSGNLYPAFRFADMIRMYFWSYKHRDAFEPGDSDLNISAERAKLDLVHETEVVKIIKALEAHLISTGAIVTPVEIERNLQERNRGRWSRPTLKGLVASASESQRQALAEVNKTLASVVGQLSRIEQAIKNQSGCLHIPAPTIFLPPATLAPPLPPPGYTQVTCAVAEEEGEAAPCS
jgi:hypothetical protein